MATLNEWRVKKKMDGFFLSVVPLHDFTSFPTHTHIAPFSHSIERDEKNDESLEAPQVYTLNHTFAHHLH